MDAWTYVKFAGGMICIMLLIYLLATATPKIAAFIDKRRGAPHAPIPERVEGSENTDPNSYEVHSPFEASTLEDYDLNDKIYNQDIYSFGNSTQGDENSDKKD